MRTDVLVVGAGIVGLAHARACAKRGLKVAVVERSARPLGASLRNFGVLWPTGMAESHQWIAQRSRALWGEAAAECGFWLDPCGVLYPAYEDDEWAVLQGFCRQPRSWRGSG